jgi:hypothetical protein
MDIDPAVTALGAYLGSKEVLGKMLGPTAEYLGNGLKSWTETSCKNVGKIFERAKARLGSKLEEPGAVPPRVLKEVLSEGQFCEEPLFAEYFGGVLASSRSGVSRDDRGARIAAQTARLSTYQLRWHYVFYSLLKLLFDGDGSLNGTAERHAKALYLPFAAFAAAMELTETEDYETILGHTMFGLNSEGLIGDYQWSRSAKDLTIGLDVIDGNAEDGPGGIVIVPTSLGVELYMWAHGRGQISTSRFLDREVVLSSDVKVTVSPGVRAARKGGPLLDAVLAARATQVTAP